MTAPAAAGRYTYTVRGDQGGESDGPASSATYSITVGSPPKADSPTSSNPAAVGLGALALLLAAAGTTWLIRRRRQV